MVGGIKVIIENFLPKKERKCCVVTFCFLVYYFLFWFEPIWLEKLKKKRVCHFAGYGSCEFPTGYWIKKKGMQEGGIGWFKRKDIVVAWWFKFFGVSSVVILLDN